MGEKDLTEKTLEAHADVFADILNVLAFDGERVIDPDELSDAAPNSSYKFDGRHHGQDRDVVKFWRNGLLRIATIGLENQTSIDSEMPIRVMSYDAADYKRQIDQNGARRKQKLTPLPYHPVATFVLYYGNDKKWTTPLSLYDMMEIHPKLRPFVSDYSLNVINVAFLDDETIDRLESDFGSIARLISCHRKGASAAEILTKPLIHVRETLELISALAGSDEFERSYREEGKRLSTLAEYLKGFEIRAHALGEKQGEARGEARGKAIGEARGKAIGEARGIIRSGRRYGATDAQIKADLVEMLNMSPADAERAISEFSAL